MTAGLHGVFARYGLTAAVESAAGERREVKAFLQPLREKNKGPADTVTSLGSVDERKWLCLTETELSEGECVTAGGGRYVVTSRAAVFLGQETTHWWAVLTPEREAAQ